MNKKMIATLAIGACCLASHASAGVNNTTVRQLFVRSDGRALVLFSTAATDHPACHSYDNKFYAFTLDTEAGQAMFKLLLEARQSGDIVDVHGSGRCDVFGGTAEDLSWVRLDG